MGKTRDLTQKRHIFSVRYSGGENLAHRVSYALVAIGDFISALGGLIAKAIGGRILQYASGGPIGASVAAAGIWTGSFVLEQQSDDYVGQQEQTLYNTL